MSRENGLGLLRLALWPPMMFPGLADMVTVAGWKVGKLESWKGGVWMCRVEMDELMCLMRMERRRTQAFLYISHCLESRHLCRRYTIKPPIVRSPSMP